MRHVVIRLMKNLQVRWSVASVVGALRWLLRLHAENVQAAAEAAVPAAAVAWP